MTGFRSSQIDYCVRPPQIVVEISRGRDDDH
jgi:hypothetical protein